MLIAFDQALNTTGYAVFNRKDGSLVAYDKFTTKSVDEEYRLRGIRNKVLELIDKYRDKEVFSFVYDYDLGICVTVMKPQPEYEVYTAYS